jgi:hypothetical protein
MIYTRKTWTKHIRKKNSIQLLKTALTHIFKFHQRPRNPNIRLHKSSKPDMTTGTNLNASNQQNSKKIKPTKQPNSIYKCIVQNIGDWRTLPVILWEKSSHQSKGWGWERNEAAKTFWSAFFSAFFLFLNPLMGPIEYCK